METNYYLVKGRVQGVSFRYYIKKEATILNITGTVKNLFNGDVEIYAQGRGKNLNSLENYIKTGPPFARIISIEKEVKDLEKQFNTFDIIY